MACIFYYKALPIVFSGRYHPSYMLKSTFKKVLGAVLIILGLIAAVMPVVPGWFLVFIGLELLGLGFLIPEWLREHGRQIRGWFARKIGKGKSS